MKILYIYENSSFETLSHPAGTVADFQPGGHHKGHRDRRLRAKPVLPNVNCMLSTLSGDATSSMSQKISKAVNVALGRPLQSLGKLGESLIVLLQP
jgi:hypothetical protein